MMLLLLLLLLLYFVVQKTRPKENKTTLNNDHVFNKDLKVKRRTVSFPFFFFGTWPLKIMHINKQTRRWTH
jgi:hypothetical protein